MKRKQFYTLYSAPENPGLPESEKMYEWITSDGEVHKESYPAIYEGYVQGVGDTNYEYGDFSDLPTDPVAIVNLLNQINSMVGQLQAQQAAPATPEDAAELAAADKSGEEDKK